MADLFDMPESAPPPQPRVFSVSEVTKAVRGVIESAFEEVWVEGEVSNYRRQASGHQYFTLKDADSQLSCVLFARGMANRRAMPMQDGMQVQAKGRLTVYEARGQYQLNVSSVQAAGAGLLQAKFEALKRKLAGEGLFDAERKRMLPEFPRAVGIVTSPTGAALRDMLNILARRAPWLRVIVSPARVQGAGAAAEIIAAMDDLRRIDAPVDVVVLARGGGSMEDLWEFNDEDLARAIAGFPIPMVSAVGHEIDFTIADFAADLRAPTPSAAAELVAPDTVDLLEKLAQTAAYLRREALAAVEAARTQLASLARSALFREPSIRIEQCEQRLDSVEQSMAHAVEARMGDLRAMLSDAASALRHFRLDQQVALFSTRLAGMSSMIHARMAQYITARRETLARVSGMLRLLSPQNTLRRGYSLTCDHTGHLLRSAADASVAGTLVTEFQDGKVISLVVDGERKARRGTKKTAD